MQALSKGLGQFFEGLEDVSLHGGPDKEGAQGNLDDGVLEKGFNIFEKPHIFEEIEELVMRYEIFNHLVILAQFFSLELNEVQ